MSGGNSGRSYTGSGKGTPDECNAVDIETPLNSPNPSILKTLKKGDVLSVEVQENAKKVKSLVAKDTQGQVAGSLTPPSLITIISCIENGHRYGATVLNAPSGGNVRVRIQPKT